MVRIEGPAHGLGLPSAGGRAVFPGVDDSAPAAAPSTIRRVDFAIRVVRADQATTLAVTGEVDLSTAGGLAEAGLDALAAGATVVIVDLSGVTFLDSTGLAALVTINNRARNDGAALIIARPRVRVRHLFQITGLDAAFTITDGGRT